eukprot:c12710_g1_i1 orf=163-645(+)
MHAPCLVHIKPTKVSSSAPRMITNSSNLSVNSPTKDTSSLQKNSGSKLEDRNIVPATSPTKQSTPSASLCLCSPTRHAGSFRCRLHRASEDWHRPATQRNSPIISHASKSRVDSINNKLSPVHEHGRPRTSTVSPPSSGFQQKQQASSPRLSRLSRVVSA